MCTVMAAYQARSSLIYRQLTLCLLHSQHARGYCYPNFIDEQRESHREPTVPRHKAVITSYTHAHTHIHAHTHTLIPCSVVDNSRTLGTERSFHRGQPGRDATASQENKQDSPWMDDLREPLIEHGDPGAGYRPLPLFNQERSMCILYMHVAYDIDYA